nr:hypothetical protein [Tanacetum cinerariifolium]
MKKTWILTRLYDVTPTIVLCHNLFKVRHNIFYAYNMESLVSTLWRNTLEDHGFVGYPFDYRVILGFGSITGGIDHVNPVIRLSLEHGISRVLGLDDYSNPSVGTNTVTAYIT